jgi:tetratricopeptide (TPR) repeat protein
MSAATFRRLGKIEQAKGAIQEAEVRDENNSAVWVQVSRSPKPELILTHHLAEQLGLYYTALGHNHHAIDAFQKALFICPDDIAASVHLCQLWLSSAGTSRAKAQSGTEIDPENVDLAAGMLSHLSKGAGWDVPEVWYFLAKAYGMQGRKDRERECLCFALGLSEHRGVRGIDTALGWCI